MDSGSFALFCIAIIAGWVDAIAGGGGLLTIPSLLYFGIAPSSALGTNKLQATLGSLTSTLYFIKKKTINLSEAKLMIVLSLIGSLLGAYLIIRLDNSFLMRIIPILLIIIGIYFLLSPDIGKIEKKAKISITLYSFTFAFIIGFYDGFFGAGTGSFFLVTLVLFLGFQLTKATAYARLMNFISNLGALLLFMLFGSIEYKIGLIMALGQIIGSLIGSKMVLKHGSKIVRPFVVIVSFLISLKLLWH